jgi:putative endonuclease
VWYVYFLLLSNGDYYVGPTNDPKRRVADHNAGRVPSTSKLPAMLASYVAVREERRARHLERYFKSGSGKKRFLTPET